MSEQGPLSEKEKVLAHIQKQIPNKEYYQLYRDMILQLQKEGAVTVHFVRDRETGNVSYHAVYPTLRTARGEQP